MALDFWRIAMRPGKPLMFGRIASGRRMRVLGLPGNPVSSLVCALLFLAPLIGALLGVPPRDPSEPAVLGVDIAANDRRQDYVRATLAPATACPLVTPLPRQDCSQLSVLAAADCLLIRAAKRARGDGRRSLPHHPPALSPANLGLTRVRGRRGAAGGASMPAHEPCGTLLDRTTPTSTASAACSPAPSPSATGRLSTIA